MSLAAVEAVNRAFTWNLEKPRVHPDGLAPGLLVPDVDQPGDAELVGDHAELVAPGLLLHRHGDVATVRQLFPVTAQPIRISLVAGQAHAEAVMGALHTRRGVGSHDR